MYGAVVQLRQLSENKFLTHTEVTGCCCHGAAAERLCLQALAKDTSAFLLELDEIGNPGSWWQVKSSYKFRSDGDVVRFGDSIELHEITMTAGSASKGLHIANEPTEAGSWHRYVEMTFEANLSEDASRLQVLVISKATSYRSKGLTGYFYTD